MSPNDDSSNQPHDVVYHVIFLSGISDRPLNPAIVELHGQHLAELDRTGQLVLAGRLVERRGDELATWPIADRQNSYRPNLQGVMSA